uniref:Vitellogenin-like protein n=1 Tax=Holotrichia oblita TaxID=644536 RepID=A0A977TNG6_HOLOL|nr:vitellogenin-like protein [Holotrichia oblita]
MWSKIVICFLVGLAAASNPTWRPNSEYVYQVRGRTLSSFSEKSDDYSGVLLRGELIIRPESEEVLTAKFRDLESAEVLSNLPDGYETDIPKSRLRYKKLQLTTEPFQIIIKNGVVVDLVVDDDVNNHEANIIKSIISQLQLNVNGENVMESRMNQLPEKGESNGIFKTMEETVTGKYETLYELNPLPKYILQSEPQWVPLPELVGDNDEIIEVAKHKNFSRAEQLPSYHYGFSGMGDFEPSTNQMEDLMSRSSFSRAIITGILKRYVIQSCLTVNKITMRPTINTEQTAMVVSILNLTLAELKSASSVFPRPSQPQHLGTLVYKYNNGFEEDNKVSERDPRPSLVYSSVSNSVSSSEENEEQDSDKYGSVYNRLRHSVGSFNSASSSSDSSDSEEEEEEAEEDDLYQNEPQLGSPPEVPLLPYYVGYGGQSIKKHYSIDIVKNVRELSQEIADELQIPENIPEKQTLSKFTILVKVSRVMNEQEMKQVADQLYEKQDGSKREAFKVYRDVLAECGTGPALLTLQHLIVTRKIEHEEAAQVLAAYMESIREPTNQLMKVLFDLTKSDVVQSQNLLNDTLIVSYADLVRKVYVSEDDSRLEFPTHVFGSFRTKEGKEFVENIYLPYLAKKLQNSVQQADSHKVLVYIRTLGNTGHRDILKVFKPYLEGEQQISQFQRLQMVVALNYLVELKPEVARSVLYKVYRNIAEKSNIRVVAVYLLIRADAPCSMLQRMAEYTNLDADEHVNAAVKSVIEAASELEGEEYSDLASKAKAALPLLTPQEYGHQYSHVHIRSEVLEELNLMYNMHRFVIGSYDSYYPQAVEYSIESSMNGIKRDWFFGQVLISSIDEVTNVFQQQLQQTKKYEEEKASATSSERNQFSSKKIIDKLQMQFDQREQLEGSVLFHLGESKRYFTFTNETLDWLPEAIQKLENSLRSSSKINYNKLTTSDEIILSFPTEMGVPFVYEHRKSSLVRASGQVKMQADPRISDGELLQVPNKIKVSAQIRAAWSKKVESSVSFLSQSEHKQYLVGYDKNINAYVPLKCNLEFDLKNFELTKEFEAIEPNENIHVLQYSSYPYIAQYNILDLSPVSESEQYNVIRDDDPRRMELSLGKEETGMSFRVELESEELSSKQQLLHRLLHRDDIFSELMSPFYDASLPYTSLNLTYQGQESSTSKVQLHSKYLSEEYSEEPRPEKQIQFDQLSQQLKQRLDQMASAAVSQISSAEVLAGEMEIKFTNQQGQQQFVYHIGGSYGRSPVDMKSRVLLHAERKSSDSQAKPYILTLESEGSTPNTNGLNYKFAKNMNPVITNDIRINIGENYVDTTEIDLKVKLSKTQERKQYLDQTPEVQQCLEDMQEGNNQLPVCANVTAQANLLDKISVKVQYKNVHNEIEDWAYGSYQAISHVLYEHVEEKRMSTGDSDGQGELQIEAQFEPDFSALNVSVKSDEVDFEINELPVEGWAEQVFVVHPVFSLRARVFGELQKNQVYYPFCTVDHSAVSTFDNKTYPASLSSSWAVLFHYVPDYAQQLEVDESEQREKVQYEEHVILSRGSDEKEIKLTIRAPETQSKLVELNLKPSQPGQHPKVLEDTTELRYSEKKAAHLQENYIKVYGLPNEEVKVEVGDDYYVIYDGHRVKITVTDDKFTDSLRGLCGTYSGDESKDFTGPKNCIIRKPEDFVYSYTIDPPHLSKVEDCEPVEYNYVKVVSQKDMGDEQSWQRGEESSGSCTKHQTQFNQESDQVCFTLHPLPVCKSSCKARGTITKKVNVHCIEKSNVAELWMKQIKKGASPDFSLKAPHKSISFEVPQKCVQ